MTRTQHTERINTRTTTAHHHPPPPPPTKDNPLLSILASIKESAPLGYSSPYPSALLWILVHRLGPTTTTQHHPPPPTKDKHLLSILATIKNSAPLVYGGQSPYPNALERVGMGPAEPKTRRQREGCHRSRYPQHFMLSCFFRPPPWACRP